MQKNNNLIIKVLSLGLGLAVGMVLIAKVCFEMSYDGFYKDVDRVYCIRTGYTMQGEDHDYGQVSGAVAPGFEAEVPGVEAGTRTTGLFDNDNYIDEEGRKVSGSLAIADTNFFKVFDRPILAGSPVKALGSWGCVMVSRSFAEKIARPVILSEAKNLDISSVIGRTIANEDMPNLKLTIEGVYEDFPRNGSLDYDILLSMETYSKESTDNWLGNDRYKGYVKLAPGVDPHSLTEAIRKMQEAHQSMEELEQNGISLRYYLSPFDKMHTSDPTVRSEVILLSIVAALLLIVSLLNYILIVISSMVKRSKEVGVRKCYGARSKDICAMLSKEAVRDILLSLALAAAIIFAGRGLIENLLGVPFTSMLVRGSVIAIAVVILLILIVSIVVPAKLYMRLPVYQALKNYTEHSRGWKLGLLGVQVLANVFMAVTLLIIVRQYRLVIGADLGYSVKDVYYVASFDGDRDAQKRIVEALESQSDVVSVACAYGLPWQGSNGDNVSLPEAVDEQLFNIADQYEVSDGFYDLLGVSIVEGRAPRDSSEMIISESFVNKMQDFASWSDGAVGKKLCVTGHGPTYRAFTISGVYKDYVIGNYVELDQRPSALFYGKVGSDKSYLPYTLFKLREADAVTLSRIRDVINNASEGKNLDIVSCSEEVKGSYRELSKVRSTILTGSIFALLVALLGLIGFVLDEARRRSKEMAIRKINGATSGEILGIFLSGILKLSVVMAVLGCVGAWAASNRYMELFARKVSVTPWYYIVGSVVVLVTVSGVVALCARRISLSNPVDSLRNE